MMIAVSGEQILLPIWHEITKQELIEHSPSLADKVARSTGSHTIQEIEAAAVRTPMDPTVRGGLPAVVARRWHEESL